MFGKLRTTVCVAAAAMGAWIAAAPAAAADSELWTDDFAAAKTRAAKEDKDLLLDFTGSDWCSWCIKLNSEVFEKKTFQEEAPEHFVLVELDFPRDKSGMSKETIQQNQKLSEKFNITGFPTILLLDAEGRPYAKTGYQRGGAEKYVQHLADLREQRETRDEHLAKAEKAEGMAKAKHLDAALRTLDPALVFPTYEEAVEEIQSLAADGDSELGGYYDAVREAPKFERKMTQALRRGGDIGPLEKELDDLVEKAGTEGALAQKLHLFKAQILHQKSGGPTEKVLERLRTAKKAAPDSRMGAQIAQIIAQLEAAADSGDASGEDAGESEDAEG